MVIIHFHCLLWMDGRGVRGAAASRPAALTCNVVQGRLIEAQLRFAGEEKKNFESFAFVGGYFWSGVSHASSRSTQLSGGCWMATDAHLSCHSRTFQPLRTEEGGHSVLHLMLRRHLHLHLHSACRSLSSNQTLTFSLGLI